MKIYCLAERKYFTLKKYQSINFRISRADDIGEREKKTDTQTKYKMVDGVKC